jgi:hypothetical protein
VNSPSRSAGRSFSSAIGFARDLREDWMRRFVEGADRGQSTLFPECGKLDR